MKTVSGSIVSSKPISLSKAASILNAFVSAETGASNGISAFLRCASESFNDLVDFHNEAKGKRTTKRHKTTSFGSLGLGNGNLADDGAATTAAADLKEGSGEMKREKKKNKKKKKKVKVEDGGVEDSEEKDERNKRRKKK